MFKFEGFNPIWRAQLTKAACRLFEPSPCSLSSPAFLSIKLPNMDPVQSTLDNASASAHITFHLSKVKQSILLAAYNLTAKDFAILCIAFLLFRASYVAIYNLYLHPLAHHPGPRLAAITEVMASESCVRLVLTKCSCGMAMYASPVGNSKS